MVGVGVDFAGGYVEQQGGEECECEEGKGGQFGFVLLL